MRWPALPVAFGVALLAVTNVAAATEDVVRARLVVEEGQVLVEASIAPGWHVNAHVPRDTFLVPTTLTLEPPPGVQGGEVVYPEPVERELAFAGARQALLYEGTLRLMAPLVGTPAPGAPPLRARLRYRSPDGAVGFELEQRAVMPLLARGHVVPGEEAHHESCGLSHGGSEQFMHCTGAQASIKERASWTIHPLPSLHRRSGA